MDVRTHLNATLHVHCLSCSRRKCHLDLSVSNWLLLLQHTSMKRRGLVGVSVWIVIRLYTNECSLYFPSRRCHINQTLIRSKTFFFPLSRSQPPHRLPEASTNTDVSRMHTHAHARVDEKSSSPPYTLQVHATVSSVF
jgi:hypothetical protein